ncbi:MAG: hypothetical protein PHG85_03685 [Candidatus Altiarchaeota archaeon]|nr:hypothetical protein [Candidatus Altiarchaeota archaeon]
MSKSRNVASHSGGGVEPPEKRIERLIQEAVKNTEGRNPKDYFMDNLRRGPYDMEIAGVFGVGREHYLDAASDYWDHHPQEKVAGMRPRYLVEVGGISLAPEAIRARMKKVSSSLDIPAEKIRIETVNDPDGLRDATIVHVDTGEQMPAGDLDNVRRALVSPGFIRGVTEELMNKGKPIVPWQALMPRRSIVILPAGVSNLDGAPYAYTGKGLRFTPGEKAAFDLLEVRRRMYGEDIPNVNQMSPSINERGLLGFSPVSPDLSGGMGFTKAEYEFYMRLLAVSKRDLSNFVDPPKLYGIFHKVKSPEGKIQGFLIDRLDDFDQRGDDEMTSLNHSYLGQLLSEKPKEKAAIIGELSRSIGEMLGRIRSGEFKKTAGDAVSDKDVGLFSRVLAEAGKTLEDFRTEQKPEKLAFFVFMTGFLESMGVKTPSFMPLLKGADPALLGRWRQDLEQVQHGAGAAGRILLEHGIAHDQLHIGNIRLKRTGPRERQVMICDWHETHDLLDMTYPQAVGHIAISAINLAHTARTTQDYKIIQSVGARLIPSGLNGFFRPANAVERGMVEEIAAQAMERDREVLSRRMRELYPSWKPPYGTKALGVKSLLDANFSEADTRPVTEIGTPLIQLIKLKYPPDMHEALKQHFSA